MSEEKAALTKLRLKLQINKLDCLEALRRQQTERLLLCVNKRLSLKLIFKELAGNENLHDQEDWIKEIYEYLLTEKKQAQEELGQYIEKKKKVSAYDLKTTK